MSHPLANFEAIIKHLTARQSEQVYRDGSAVSMNVRLDKSPSAVTLLFRPSGVMRISIALPVEVTDASREAFELTALTLNRTGLGATLIVGRRGLLVFTQVPIGKGPLPSHVLDRSIDLCIERAKTTLPMLRRVHRTGAASV